MIHTNDANDTGASDSAGSAASDTAGAPELRVNLARVERMLAAWDAHDRPAGRCPPLPTLTRRDLEELRDTLRAELARHAERAERAPR